MKLETQKDKVSYILGEDIGRSIISQGYDLNVDILVETIKNVALGKMKAFLLSKKRIVLCKLGNKK